MHERHPAVPLKTQILIGKPFQCILQWVEEVQPSLLILARHGGHRIEGTDIGSQAENLCRLTDTNVLLIGTTDVRPDEIPWIEEDGETGLEWAPEAEVRILRVPPFALGIARKAVEEFVLDNYGAGANGTYAGEAAGRANGTSGNNASANAVHENGNGNGAQLNGNGASPAAPTTRPMVRAPRDLRHCPWSPTSASMRRSASCCPHTCS